MIHADLVTYMAVKKSTNDKGDLVIGNDLLVNEVVLTAMFELVHDRRGNISL